MVANSLIRRQSELIVNYIISFDSPAYFHAWICLYNLTVVFYLAV